MSTSSLFASPCFSGDCGLCLNCSGNYETTMSHKKSKSFMKREDLSKIYGKQNLEECEKEYMQEMKELCKKRNYKNPELRGTMPLKIMFQDNKYTFVSEYHDLVCHEPMCQARYENSVDHIRKSHFNCIPIYQRDKNKANLCAICMNRFKIF